MHKKWMQGKKSNTSRNLCDLKYDISTSWVVGDKIGIKFCFGVYIHFSFLLLLLYILSKYYSLTV